MVEELTPGGEGIKIWWGESTGEIFPDRGNTRIFGRGGLPPSLSPVGKTLILQIHVTISILWNIFKKILMSCQKYSSRFKVIVGEINLKQINFLFLTKTFDYPLLCDLNFFLSLWRTLFILYSAALGTAIFDPLKRSQVHSCYSRSTMLYLFYPTDHQQTVSRLDLESKTSKE